MPFNKHTWINSQLPALEAAELNRIEQGIYDAHAAIDSGVGGGGASILAATETTLGTVELATAAEAVAGTDTSRAITPAALKVVTDTKASTAHKATHAIGGSDALSPADIGAATSSHTHALGALTDVSTTGATTGQALVKTATGWAPGTVASSGGSWSPLSLPNLYAWYDPSDSATITAAGGMVSQLNDKGPNSLHLTQPDTAYQPYTGTRQINGLNVMDSDAHRGLYRGALTPPNPAVMTVAGIVKFDVVTSTSVALALGAQQAWPIAASTNRWMIEGGVGNYTNSAVDATIATAGHQFTTVMQSNGSTNSILRIDGSERINAVLTATTFNQISFLGYGNNNYSYDLDGAMGELILVNGVLSPDDMAKLEFYLRSKWGFIPGTTATETAAGVVELSTAAEATAGTSSNTVITPATLKVVTDTKASTTHKATHATGGTDALTPGDIGAQPAGSYALSSHTHALDALSSGAAASGYIPVANGAGVITWTAPGATPFVVGVGTHTLTVDLTAPSAPQVGDLWVDTN